MTGDTPFSSAEEAAFSEHRRSWILLRELRKRSAWFIQLRWWVPPAIATGVFVANVLDIEVAALEILLVAAFILAYNLVFSVVHRKLKGQATGREIPIRRFTYWQVIVDYLAMFLLIHFTGGVASPVIFFFVFHVVFASILLPSRSAYAFAAMSVLGMVLIALAEQHGLLPHRSILVASSALTLQDRPYHVILHLSFFAASVFITAFATSAIMRMLRMRMIALDGVSASIAELLDRLNALYVMIEAVGSKQTLSEVLDEVQSKLIRVANIKALSVKLLSEDGTVLKYAAAHGLPEPITLRNTVIVERSPVNKRIIQGEPFVTGHVTQSEMFQFGEDLAAGGLKSVLFVPLRADKKIIGILGAYCTELDRFGEEDIEFMQQAAGLIAMAIENARAFEAIQELGLERSRFMMKVTHNLRAPLSASISMVNLMREGYLGDLNDNVMEYLRRVERRLRTMLLMINELMILARSRLGERDPRREAVDPAFLAGRIERTFLDDARQKGLGFDVVVAEHLEPIAGDADILEQVLENLVANAVKYTREGEVRVDFGAGPDKTVRIEVRDTGIGIRDEDKSSVFCDFFRAENARILDENGTGLGLAIVKQAVERHRGRIQFESQEGKGTTFTVILPAFDEESQDGSGGNPHMDGVPVP